MIVMASPQSIFRVTVMLLFATTSMAWAQVPAIDVTPKTPYYLDVNQLQKSDIRQIQYGLLNLQYDDKYGSWKSIPLQIFNWKMESVGVFNLDKSFGLNHYTINLTEKISGLETNRVYFCLMADEGGNRHEWGFKDITPVKSEEFTVDIIANPLQLSCASQEGNRVEFYGEIHKGKGPYSVRWFVMNEGQSDFLYQPKEDRSVEQGKTSVIQVDKAPAYYVVLDVTDACGTNARKMVFLQCDEEKKKINTIFVEPSPDTMAKIRIIN